MPCAQHSQLTFFLSTMPLHMKVTTELSVSNKTILRIVAIVIASYVALDLAVRLRTQLVWIAIAFFLALALEPAVKRLSSVMPRKSRGLAVAAVLILLIAVLGLVGYVLIPPFASQIYKLVVNLPHSYQSYVMANPKIARLAARMFHIPDTSTAISQLSNQLLNYGGSAISLARSIGGGIFAATTVLLLTLFMVLEGPHWAKVFWEFTPAEKRERWQPIVSQLHGTITGYVNGNLIKSGIAAVATAVILMVLGSPYVLALSLLVAIFDLIPMVGATLAAILVSLAVLMFLGVTPAVIMLAFFLIFQQIENNLVQPLVFSKTVEVSPLVTIIALILGASLAGLVGALVAIPVAASAQILVRTWASNRRLPKQKD